MRALRLAVGRSRFILQPCTSSFLNQAHGALATPRSANAKREIRWDVSGRKRTRRDLDAISVSHFRVARGLAVQLAEVLDVVESKVVP